MNQFDFHKTLGKYLSGEHSPEEEAMIMDYFKANPLEETAVFEAEKAAIGKRIKGRLEDSLFGKTWITRLRPWLAAAASIVVLLGCIYFWYGQDKMHNAGFGKVAQTGGALEISNNSEKPKRVPLEDGSVIILKKNSSLSIPEHFGAQNRQVYLRGEAFFQVRKNPAKPFIVSTGSLETKVLGTSFNVKCYDGSPSVEVQVKTGKVSVYEGSDKKTRDRNGVILTQNQKIVFDKKSRKMELSIVENPSLIVPKDKIAFGFTFEDIPVKHVFAALEKSYGIDIFLENETADSCLFTGDLNGLTLFQQLDLICKSANISYERRGTALFVQGAGCIN